MVLCHARLPVNKEMGQAFLTSMMTFADVNTFTPNFAKVYEFVSVGARSHPDARMRQLCKFHLAGCAMGTACFSVPSWDWDKIFLDDDGAVMVEQVLEMYDFDQCHPTMIRSQGQWGS